MAIASQLRAPLGAASIEISLFETAPTHAANWYQPYAAKATAQGSPYADPSASSTQPRWNGHCYARETFWMVQEFL